MDINHVYVPCKSLTFVGDLHGNFYQLLLTIEDSINTCFIVCGDFGIGFNSNELENYFLSELKTAAFNNNNYIIVVRGNHDNPNKFIDRELNNLMLIEDFSIVHINDDSILCIGGGISIDREPRKQRNYGYWENEPIKYYDLENFNYSNFNIIASHISPISMYPYKLSELVYSFCANDDTLESDLMYERTKLDEFFHAHKNHLTHWYYGHYHSSRVENKNGVKCVLLNCNEFYEAIDDKS